MNRFRTSLQIASHSWRVVAGFVAAVALFAVTSLERILRQLLPAIFSVLPEDFRRILLLASQIPAVLPIVWAHFKQMRQPSCSFCAA